MVLRSFLSLLLLATLPGLAHARLDITLDYVAKKAEERALKPFRSPRADLPAVLRQDNLDYDKYREIEFRHEKALWTDEDLPFRIEFFHPGYLYQEPVHVNEFTLTAVQPIRFVQDFFNYRSLRIQKQIPANTGYAGFRVLFPLNEPDKWDELGSFLGASYYRLLGKDQRYGVSARGLAIDCGEPDRPEEFPIFTDWWLGKPHRADNQLCLYAILDSVSCVGAFEFLIRPGETTIADVEAVVFLRDTNLVQAADAQRKPIRTIGLAPLTSMFWFGKNSERKFDDYRPEVHDSDGLLMHMENDELLWRPLNNAAMMRHQKFATKNLRGFGLLQRERDFSAYQDIFNHYHQVPSVWVEPRGSWGEGDVHLVELSTGYEGLDNIVAFWDPKVKPQPMEPYRFAYTLSWMLGRDTELSPNRVIATRIGADPRDPGKRQFVIDYDGPRLIGMSENDPPQPIVNCSDNAVITETQIFPNPVNHSWRVIFKLQPKAGNKDPVDLRCTLKKGDAVVSETWTVPLEPAMITTWAATDPSGRLAGRPLEEWNTAYLKVESYFHALRIRNKVLLGQLVQRVLERATRRAPEEPNRSATELAAEELDQLVTEWFATVMERIPTGVEQMLSTRGRLAMLLADMPGKWQDQFLQPGPWPEEFVTAMQEMYLHAGPDFQLSMMAPRALDLGPLTTLTSFSRLPYAKWASVWLLFAIVLVVIFLRTHH